MVGAICQRFRPSARILSKRLSPRTMARLPLHSSISSGTWSLLLSWSKPHQSAEWLQVRGLEIQAQHPDFTVLSERPDQLAIGIVQDAHRVVEPVLADQVRAGQLEA